MSRSMISSQCGLRERRKEMKNSRPHRSNVIKKYAQAFGVEPEQLSQIGYQLLQRTLSAALTARVERKRQS